MSTKSLYLALGIAIAAVLASQNALASQDRVLATNNKSGRTLSIPAHAVEVAPNVFSLGVSLDPETGEAVEGYLIAHPKNAYGKPPGTPGGGGSKGGKKCYGFLAEGAKWKTVEPWVVNPENSYGISDASIFSILSGGIAKWENAANRDLIGNGSVVGTALSADLSSMDMQNEVYFGPLDPGTIGVTIVWGIFGGPPEGRELREWDQVYNTAYDWSDTGVSTAMDFDNIATHELGHSFGMGDLYDSGCSEETMYGYGTEGETKKRDLNQGDIAGIRRLYR